jgi:protein-S-isoprenylcysteine O-methyltransferase
MRSLQQMMFIAVCVLWVTSEILLQITRRASADSHIRDRSSLRLLNRVIYTAIPLGILAAFTNIGVLRFHRETLRLAGLLLIMAGLGVRWTAILTLRRYFTVNVAIQPGHVIVRKGLYRWIRHPSYLGLLLAFLGLGVSMANAVTLVVILLPATAALIRRIRIEELALLEAFGVEYQAYCIGTWRLIPGVY